MKTVRSSINKNIKMILIIAAVTAVALGGLLLLISGNEDRDQVPTDPTVPGETEETTEQEETTQPTETSSEEGISKIAQKLFAAKVDSITDSAAVATLLETINLKGNVANYMVELQVKEDPKSVNIRFDQTVKQENKDLFDKKVQIYAEQILALISDVQQVQWMYNVKTETGSVEQVTMYLNEQQARELLKNDVKLYGTSEKTVDALLRQQKGN